MTTNLVFAAAVAATATVAAFAAAVELEVYFAVLFAAGYHCFLRVVEF